MKFEVEIRVVLDATPGLLAALRGLVAGVASRTAAAEPAAAPAGPGEAPAMAPAPPPPQPVAEALPPGPRAMWKTAERVALMRASWPVGASPATLSRALAAMPGAPLPRGDGWLYGWARALGLSRPPLPRPTRRVVVKAPTEDVAPAPVAPPPAVVGDTVPAMPGVVETPQLKRARELLGMGLDPNEIRDAVRLSASEMAAVRAAYQGGVAA